MQHFLLYAAYLHLTEGKYKNIYVNKKEWGYYGKVDDEVCKMTEHCVVGFSYLQC